MGLRFRKSIKIAPGLKINLNKNSISATVGTKGAHYTVNSKGKRTASVGIPGTGISYTQTTGGKSKVSSKKADTSTNSYTYSQPNNTEPNNNDKKWYQKTGWIIAWLILFFPVGLFLMWKYSDWKKAIKVIVTALFACFTIAAITSPTLEDVSLSADTSKTYDIKQDIPIKATVSPSDYELSDTDFNISGGELKISDGKITFSAIKGGTYEVYVKHEDIKSNTLKFKIEDKKAIAKKKAEEAKKKAEEEAKRKAEEEAKRKAEEEARIAAEQEAQRKAEQEARLKAEQEAKRRAEQNTPPANQTHTQAPQQSSQSGGTVYWVSGGSVYHSTPNCATLKRSSNIRSGSITESGKSKPCKVCH